MRTTPNIASQPANFSRSSTCRTPSLKEIRSKSKSSTKLRSSLNSPSRKRKLAPTLWFSILDSSTPTASQRTSAACRNNQSLSISRLCLRLRKPPAALANANETYGSHSLHRQLLSQSSRRGISPRRRWRHSRCPKRGFKTGGLCSSARHQSHGRDRHRHFPSSVQTPERIPQPTCPYCNHRLWQCRPGLPRFPWPASAPSLGLL